MHKPVQFVYDPRLMFNAFWMQSVGVLVMLAVVLFSSNVNFALAMGYGLFISLVNSGMLVWRWHKGRYDYHCNGGRHLRAFNRSSIERFVIVSLLFAAGFSGLGGFGGFVLTNLSAEWILAGFIVGQLAWLLALVLARRLF